jgi:tetratricopeptide (TPR) repeat protein
MASVPPLNDRLAHALAAHRAGKLADAERGYADILKAQPRHFDALHMLGVLRLQQKRLRDAFALISEALLVNPRSPDALYNLGLALDGLGAYEDALDRYDRALALRPDLVGVLTSRANTLLSLGRYEDAIASCQRALALKPDHANAHLNESLARLALGDFAGGWPKYEWRLGGRPSAFAQPQWRGDVAFAGRTILLHAEQGLGDTIQFLRYLPAVVARDAQVVLRIQPEIAPLVPSDAAVQVVPDTQPLPPFDLHCPLPSLPLAFATTLETIPAPVPYLRTDGERAAAWASRLAGDKRLRVGLTWTGNPGHPRDRHRSMRFGSLMPLLGLPNVVCVGLYKDVRPEDADMLTAEHRLMPVGEAFADFAGVAAVISRLDLVISVDTSIAHLAGALGKPVWIMLPFAADWRWLTGREDSPWYPTARLFRQPRHGDWDSVIARIRAELAALAAAAVR